MAISRGVLHVHSTFSDGTLSPVQLKTWAMAENLDFLILCEHASCLSSPQRFEQAWRECRQLSDDGFLMALGLEFDFRGRHVLLLGPSFILSRARAEEVVEHPEKFRENGCISIWAHPTATYEWSLRNGMTAQYDGWEVWNRLANGPVPDLPMLGALRKARSRGRNLLAFAGSDFHFEHHTLSPILEIEMQSFSFEALSSSLRQGSFRSKTTVSSQGFTLYPTGEIRGTFPAWGKAYAITRDLLLRGRCMGALLRHRLIRRHRSKSKERAAKRPSNRSP